MLQADGMCYSFTCPLLQYDVPVLQASSMLAIVSALLINNDPLRLVKSKTDKAYGWTQHLHPLHASLETTLSKPHE